MADVLLRDCRLWGRDEVADVLVRDGVIAGVGAGVEAGEAEVVDIAGRRVLPGLVEAELLEEALRRGASRRSAASTRPGSTAIPCAISTCCSISPPGTAPASTQPPGAAGQAAPRRRRQRRVRPRRDLRPVGPVRQRRHAGASDARRLPQHVPPRRGHRAATYGGARALGLGAYGLDVGATADLVVVPARRAAEAIVRRPPRDLVLQAGRPVASAGRLV